MTRETVDVLNILFGRRVQFLFYFFIIRYFSAFCFYSKVLTWWHRRKTVKLHKEHVLEQWEMDYGLLQWNGLLYEYLEIGKHLYFHCLSISHKYLDLFRV